MFLPLYQPDNIYPDTEWHHISGKEFADFTEHLMISFTGEKIYSDFLPVKLVVYLLMNVPSSQIIIKEVRHLKVSRVSCVKKHLKIVRLKTIKRH